MNAWHTGPLLLLALAAPGARAQMLTGSGTTLSIEPGTSLRVEAPVTWAIADGAAVVNDGMIVLGPQAVLQEADGAPITGAGTERCTRVLSSSANAEDLGGLGLELTTAVPLGTTTVIRGHLPYTDTAEATSIARWYRVLPTTNSGLGALLGFHYDATELNGIDELAQAVHIATVEDTVWNALNSTVSSVDRRVDAGPVDSLGLFTTFEVSIPTGSPVLGAALRPFLTPNPASDRIVLHLPDGARMQRLEVLTADGRPVMRTTMNVRAQEGGIPIAIDGLAPGVYLLRLDGLGTLPFVKR